MQSNGKRMLRLFSAFRELHKLVRLEKKRRLPTSNIEPIMPHHVFETVSELVDAWIDFYDFGK
jgi:hypothetical protein